MKYSDYTVADFVADEYFEKWVNRPDPEVNAFWEAWVAAHPEKKPVIEEAANVVRVMKFSPSKYSKKEASHLLKRIHTTIDEKENKTSVTPLQDIFSQKFLNFWYLAAAVLVLLIISVIVYPFFPGSDRIKYTTRFGEKKVIILPDSSKVILNANSSMYYAANWPEDVLREVFLKGEAFFEIRKQPYTRDNKFVVYTQQLNVEVLGTQFNVSEREGITTVTLNEGTIKLNAESLRDVIMEPGEQAELTHENDFEIRKVNTNLYTSWKDNKLVFEDANIREIAQIIEHTYGYELVVLDSAIYQRKFTGTLPGDNINIILKTLSELYELDIAQNEKKILLKKGE